MKWWWGSIDCVGKLFHWVFCRCVGEGSSLSFSNSPPTPSWFSVYLSSYEQFFFKKIFFFFSLFFSPFVICQFLALLGCLENTAIPKLHRRQNVKTFNSFFVGETIRKQCLASLIVMDLFYLPLWGTKQNRYLWVFGPLYGLYMTSCSNPTNSALLLNKICSSISFDFGHWIDFNLKIIR